MTEASRAQPPGPLVPGDGGSQGDYTAVTEPRISPIPQSEILNRGGGHLGCNISFSSISHITPACSQIRLNHMQCQFGIILCILVNHRKGKCENAILRLSIQGRFHSLRMKNR